MLPAALDRLLALPDTARVLDVGGWAAPVNRADWVIDIKPYETRGVSLPNGFGPKPERFSRDTWLQIDMCDCDPWPFDDDYFDFVICTFTLEDLRDPITVCRQMSRVAKAGYIEVPSLLDELTWNVPEVSGGPWAGHSHHRWICKVEDGELLFLNKFHSLHSNWRYRVPPRWAAQLSVEERCLVHSWTGTLRAREWMAIAEYPYDELEAAIRERFKPSPAELRVFELREQARDAAAQVVGPVRGAAVRAFARLMR